MYFIVRVTSSQERITTDILQNKVEKSNLPVYSIIIAEGMRGYLIIEAENENVARELILDEPHVKGMLLEAAGRGRPQQHAGDQEGRAGHRRQRHSRVHERALQGVQGEGEKVDETKEEITVELMDVAVPIPVTTKASIAKIVQKAEKV